MSAHRRIALVAAVALLALASAPAARGAGALHLRWSDCPGASSAQTATSSCAANTGSQDLICAFQVEATVDSVLGVEVVVDLQHAEATLPDWWHVEVGGCRVGALQASFDFRLTDCADFLHGDAAGGLQDFTVGRPKGQPSQAEIRAAASLLPAYGYATLDPALTYGAARLRLSNMGTSFCAGCSGSACLVLNSVRLVRQPGAIGGDVLVESPGTGDANWAYWQTSAANCAAVPVRATTWGQLKGLYR